MLNVDEDDLELGAIFVVSYSSHIHGLVAKHMEHMQEYQYTWSEIHMGQRGARGLPGSLIARQGHTRRSPQWVPPPPCQHILLTLIHCMSDQNRKGEDHFDLCLTSDFAWVGEIDFVESKWGRLEIKLQMVGMKSLDVNT
ncbi:hypothetical protein ZWY2020_040418 [Hordeum vulgare]|nr:hypothetical protein ZWY2020_040418 [Hordeum vulgare]